MPENVRSVGVGRVWDCMLCIYAAFLFEFSIFFFSRKYSYCSRLRKAVPLPFAKCLPVCGQFGVTIRCRIGVRTRMRRYAMPHSRAFCAKQPLFAFPPACHLPSASNVPRHPQCVGVSSRALRTWTTRRISRRRLHPHLCRQRVVSLLTAILLRALIYCEHSASFL